MVDRCIVCGEIIPEGRHVCTKCENSSSNNSIRCPKCGAVLEIMNSHWYCTLEGHARNTIFHCNVCGDDWEKDEEYIAKPAIFKRKYWG